MEERRGGWCFGIPLDSINPSSVNPWSQIVTLMEHVAHAWRFHVHHA